MTNEEVLKRSEAIDARERDMKDEIDTERERLQVSCQHEKLRFCPDAAGGNDSEWYCPACRRFFTKDPRKKTKRSPDMSDLHLHVTVFAIKLEK